MSIISIEQALSKAIMYEKKGAIEEARKLYYDVLHAFPKNKRAKQGLKALKSKKYSALTKGLPQENINQLVKLYNQGALLEVIDQANLLIERDPGAFIVWNLLGAASKGLGRINEASEAFKKVTKLNPTYANGFINLGVTLKDQGLLDEAIASYKKALLLKPDYAEAYFNMGNALKDQGQLNKAIVSYQKALSIKSDYAEAYNNKGVVLNDQGKFDEALVLFDKALLLKVDFADAFFNKGNSLKGQRKHIEAIASYEKSLRLRPDCVEACFNLGAALQDQGKFDQAIGYYKKTLSLEPNHAVAYYNMGNAQQSLRKFDEMMESYKKALLLKPDYVAAYHNMGTALQAQGRFDEAIASYEKALILNPGSVKSLYNMGNVLKDKGKLDEAIAYYEKALSLKPDYARARAQKLYLNARICDWSSIRDDNEYLAGLGTTGKAVPPFSIIPLEDAPDQQLLRSAAYARERYSNDTINFLNRPGKRPRRLRIGYFSSDFNEHPVAYLIAKVLEQHNRNDFEVFGYSLRGNKQSELRQRLINSFDTFVDVQELGDLEVAIRARQDNIDIAVDLNGYTKFSRPSIFAYRAAPIQINYLGFPGTMGADFMDYIVSDQYLIPPENQKYFAEKQLYLPDTYMPTDNGRKLSNRPITRSDMGLPADSFVFCCFNNNYKITSAEFDIWMRLLTKVKGSVLWMRSSNRWSELNIKKEAQKRKVAPERIVFADKVPMDEHLARHRLADLFLDTFAFNAHTTASEALWAGLPVVTKVGKSFASRVAGSLLNAIGLPELITESEEVYEALALDLATNRKRLSKMQAKVKSNRLSKPLFDTERYTKHLETGYKMAYDKYLNEKDKDHIFVPRN